MSPVDARASLQQRLQTIAAEEGFPALSNQVLRIQQLTGNEHEKLQRLTDEIMKDVALTQRLLRLANSVRFKGQQGGVVTVSRAVALLGFAAVRNLTLGLMLLEHMAQRGQRQLVQQAYEQALFAATLASHWSESDPEQAFLGALLQDLGSMLMACYFPDEALALRTLDAGKPGAAQAQQRQLLGFTLSELALAVAQQWGLPQDLQQLMQPPSGPPPGRVPSDALSAQRWVVSAAHQVLAELRATPLAQQTQQLQGLCRRYMPALGQSVQALMQGYTQSCQSMQNTAAAIGLELSQSMCGQLCAVPASSPLAHGDTKPGGASHPSGERAPERSATQEDRTWADLALVLEQVNDALAQGSLDRSQLQALLLQSLREAMAATRVVLCWRDESGQTLVGCQEAALELGGRQAAFRVELEQPRDFFALLTRQPRDTWIENARQESVYTRLPPWLLQQTTPRAFLWLPLRQAGQAVGAVYVENPRLAAQGMDQTQATWLRIWKNLLLLVQRQ